MDCTCRVSSHAKTSRDVVVVIAVVVAAVVVVVDAQKRMLSGREIERLFGGSGREGSICICILAERVKLAEQIAALRRQRGRKAEACDTD